MPKAKTWLGAGDRHARLRKIETLDPQKDCREIARLFYEDFGSIMVLQSFAGFLMTYAAPRMSRILGSTGESEHRVAKRVLDTALLARTVLNHGLDSPGPGRDAARRVNAMHRRYDINQLDFVMVGVDQILMGVRAAERFGWRPVTDIEREGLKAFYTQETRYFGGQFPLPATFAAMRLLHERYLNEELTFEPQNLRMTDVMIGFIKLRFPPLLRPIAAPMLLAQVDPRILRACGKRVPGALTKWLSLMLFRALGRQGPIPDGAPDGLQDLIDKVYPNGYSIDAVGTHVNEQLSGPKCLDELSRHGRVASEKAGAV
jgi:ER-bound oxygenase mpaB/B'/Rubber oxygenase, catalytic domain